MAGMRPDDVVRLGAAADPRVAPDGSTVAHVRAWIDPEAMEYRSAVEVVAVDGSSPPRRITSGEGRIAEPRWSPDGEWLAYTSAEGKDDPPQLRVIAADGSGEPRTLTERDEKVEQIAWSPDGSRIAFASRVRDAAYGEPDESKREPRRIHRLLARHDNEGWTIDRPRHLFVVDAEGSGAPRQLTGGDAEDEHPAWSPDGRSVVFTSARHEDWDLDWVRDLYVVDADEPGELRRLTAGDGACDLAAWSPDGATIAYLFSPGVLDEPRNGQVAVLGVTTGGRRLLSEVLDRTCAPYPPIRAPAWDGDDVIFAYEDRGAVVLARVPAAGGDIVDVVRADACVTGFDVAAGRLVHTSSDPRTLPELYAGERRLTDVSGPFREHALPIAPVAFTATSPDGTQVDAWAILPPGKGGVAEMPLLLNIHGGPFTQYGLRLFDEFQVYAGAGYGVIFANPRGSSGFTEAWGRAIRGPIEGGPGWGSRDHDDLMAVVDEALARFPILDPERMGVMGGSYGGYMTSWVVGHTDRFRCGISERAVNDAISMEGASDIAGFFQAYAGGAWWQDRAAYLAISPASFVEHITTPLLILHSEDDLRCPIGQGEQLFVALRRLGRDVEMVRFPKESHELTRSGSPTHRVRRFEIVLEFLARHLGGEPAGAQI
jgi:dipeptidyl aminopeptidase/acylaminoacyl peptidase